MRQQANRHRSEREFEVKTLVYLKLQSYKQHSVKKRWNHKLSPKFFGPFLVIARVGKVAYKMQLPPRSKVHPIFHVSQLKKHVGTTPVQSVLPVVDVQ